MIPSQGLRVGHQAKYFGFMWFSSFAFSATGRLLQFILLLKLSGHNFNQLFSTGIAVPVASCSWGQSWRPHLGKIMFVPLLQSFTALMPLPESLVRIAVCVWNHYVLDLVQNLYVKEELIRLMTEVVYWWVENKEQETDGTGSHVRERSDSHIVLRSS